MAKVSVIIPVYNVEKYLKECLNSVINQTLKDIEIICINDGSIDDSLKIMQEYASKDSRIKILNQKNQGVSEARNFGIKIATGEYIAFLDSDDCVSLDFYEKLYTKAKETNSDIVVSEYMYRINNKNGKKKKIFLKVDKNIETTDINEKFKCLYLPRYCYVMNKIYKRSCGVENFIKGLNWEDVYFTVNMLNKSEKLSVAANAEYYYRDNPSSIVNEKSNINEYYYHKAFAYFYNFVCENNIDININEYSQIKKYKFLGFTILKVEKYYFSTKYKLLNLISWTCT